MMERNRNVIESDINTIVFHMNGGLDYNDAWLLTNDQRTMMAKMIEKHFAAQNPKKNNQL